MEETMSHQITIIKTRGDDPEDTKTEVEAVVEESITEGSIFESVTFVELITEDKFSDYGITSLQELEKRAPKQGDVKEFINSAVSQILPSLAENFLPNEEIPTQMNRDNLKSTLEKILTQPNRSASLPTNFDEFLRAVETILLSLAQSGMGTYYLKKAARLAQALQDQDTQTYLACIDVHYVDITDETQGENVYYFGVSRYY